MNPAGTSPPGGHRQRIVPVEGFGNLHDIGGYQTRSGGTTRPGLLFWSETVRGLDAANLGALATVGIRAVLDLREGLSDVDRTLGVSDGIVHLTIPIQPCETANSGYSAESAQRESSVMVHWLSDLYISLLESHAEAFGAAVACVADPNYRPALLHCTAGKDRTAIVMALILDLLGVSRDDVTHDHAVTTQLRSEPSLARLAPLLAPAGIDLTTIEGFFDAPGEALRIALAYLDQRYGSADGYLGQTADVSPAVIVELRSQLVRGEERWAMATPGRT